MVSQGPRTTQIAAKEHGSDENCTQYCKQCSAVIVSSVVSHTRSSMVAG